MAKVGLVKEFDKDLQLYLDISKTLNDYRIFIIPITEVKEWNKIKQVHNKLLERLAKRLGIKTIIKTKF